MVHHHLETKGYVSGVSFSSKMDKGDFQVFRYTVTRKIGPMFATFVFAL
jgi:hypothetical protein